MLAIDETRRSGSHFAAQPCGWAVTAHKNNQSLVSGVGGSPYRQGRQFVTTPSHRGFRRMESVRQFIREEDGQDVVEYGLLIASIAIVVLIGIGFFGSNINAWFETLARRVTTTGTP